MHRRRISAKDRRRVHSRWWYVAALALGIYLVATFDLTSRVHLPSGRVSTENCYRVQKGMTRQQVELVLGTPTSVKDGLGWWWSDSISINRKTTLILVEFNQDGLVESKECFVIGSDRGPRFFR